MLKWINKKRNQKGFTLIELIVVIAILGILGALAIPKFTGTRATANAGVVKATLRNIESAIQIVSSELNVEPTSDKVTENLVLAQLGWTKFPTDSPNGIIYSFAHNATLGAGRAVATKNDDMKAWPDDPIDGLTALTAKKVYVLTESTK